MKLDVQFEELFLAYKHAKSNLFFERRGLGMPGLAKFEWTLRANLKRLKTQLAEGTALGEPRLAGDFVVLPQRFTPCSDREISRYTDYELPADVTVELRLQLVPSPALAIVEALWILRFGGFVQSCIPVECCGAPLNTHHRGQARHEVRRFANGSFQPWFSAYRNWKNGAYQAAERHLSEGEAVAVIRTDIRSYYDSIDPRFVLDPDFFTGLRDDPRPPDGFFEMTRWLIDIHASWRDDVGVCIPGMPQSLGQRGLNIGSTFARVLANLALSHLDRAVADQRHVLFYSRYVDDLHIVTGAANATSRAVEVLAGVVPIVRAGGDAPGLDETELRLPNSRLAMQMRKLSVEVLQGAAGLEHARGMLEADAVVASEHRLFPDPDWATQTAAAPVVLDGDEQPDLAHVFGTTPSDRYAMSVLLGKHVALAAMCDPESWGERRRASLRKLGIRLRQIEDYPDNLGLRNKLLTAMIANGDFSDAAEVVTADVEFLRGVLRQASDVRLAGRSVEKDRVTELTCASVMRMALESAVKAFPLSHVSESGEELEGVATLLSSLNSRWSAFMREALRIQSADLGIVPVRRSLAHLSRLSGGRGKLAVLESRLRKSATPEFQIVLSRLDQFLHAAAHSAISPLGGDVNAVRLILMTRPPAYWEICAALVRTGVRSGNEITEVVNAVRGTERVSGWFTFDDEGGRLRAVMDPVGLRKPGVYHVAVGSQPTTGGDWLAAVRSSAPLPRADRVEDLGKIVNATLTRKPRVDLLVLPELSVPRALIEPLISTLSDAGISLLAGIEYLHTGGTDADGLRYVANEALIVHSEDFARTFADVYRKRIPARDEARNLREAGAVLLPGTEMTTIYDMGDACLGVLICNELTDINRRAELRGAIDVLVIPAWNRDITSFAALIESASLDVHATIVCANNAEYSDSRVRAPYRANWKRDVARIIAVPATRHGDPPPDNDPEADPAVIFASVEVATLRDEQYRQAPEELPPDSKDLHFKPVPTGFAMGDHRRPGRAALIWPFDEWEPL